MSTHFGNSRLSILLGSFGLGELVAYGHSLQAWRAGSLEDTWSERMRCRGGRQARRGGEAGARTLLYPQVSGIKGVGNEAGGMGRLPLLCSANRRGESQGGNTQTPLVGAVL